MRSGLNRRRDWRMLHKGGLAIGPELLVNGDFASSSAPPTLGANETISGGALHCAESSSVPVAIWAIAFVAGATYRYTFTIANYSSGVIQAEYQQGSNVFGTQRSANGTYTQDMVAGTGNANFQLICTAAGFHADILNASLIKIG